MEINWTTVATVLGASGGVLAIVAQVVKKVMDSNVETATIKAKKDEVSAAERSTIYQAQKNFLDNLQETVAQLESKNTALESRIEGQRKRIDELIGRLDEMSEQNTQLRIQNRILTSRVAELEAELDKFNRRVYYDPKKDGGTQ